VSEEVLVYSSRVWDYDGLHQLTNTLSGIVNSRIPAGWSIHATCLNPQQPSAQELYYEVVALKKRVLDLELTYADSELTRTSRKKRWWRR
jgi:hypothetical protein